MSNYPHGPEWENVDHFFQASDCGEITPFLFKGRKYILHNRSVINGSLNEGELDCAEIIDWETREKIAVVMRGHYFVEAYVANDRCYCFGGPMSYKHWDARQINMIYSDDLIHWSEPVPIVKHDFLLYNTSVTFDGKRYVLLYEHNDPQYPCFTFYFMQSEDLLHWERIPDAIFAQDHYAGGPCLHYIADDQLYYLTWVHEFTNPATGALNYDTCISRSSDLIHWEYGNRPVITPDYGHRTDPEHYPDVYEINASDAEFLETHEGVRCFWSGGNQQGVSDEITGVFRGSLKELFHRFF